MLFTGNKSMSIHKSAMERQNRSQINLFQRKTFSNVTSLPPARLLDSWDDWKLLNEQACKQKRVGLGLVLAVVLYYSVKERSRPRS